MDTLQGLQVWNRACGLATETYRSLANCADPAFRDQVTRTSLALAASIATGYERRSRPQFAQGLRAARMSCAELRTQLYIAADIGLLENSRAHELIAQNLALAKLLQALIERCERSH